MTKLISILKLTFLVALTYSSFAIAHGNEEARISIEPEVQGNLTAGKIIYGFQLFDSKTRKTIKDADLKETHTKIIHMIVYDSSLNEFNHVHPEFVDSVWIAELNFQKNGTYFIWTQGQLTDGTDFSTYTKTEIVSGEPAIPSVPLGDNREGQDSLTVLTLADTKVRAGKMAMVNFSVTRGDGQEPQLSPYLGAMAHVIAVAPDGDELIHVHPMAADKPNKGMIHATFPSAGDYRIWIQIVDRDELKTIPLSITVLE